ncbi:MAG: DegT/DnrJ/EryC1/StrS family aminotransferase [Rhodospirillales bacterium]
MLDKKTENQAAYELAASSWGPEEFAAIERVVFSNRFTMGPEVACLEEEFAAWHDKKYGVMVNSGSSANLVAVASLFYRTHRPLQRGDEVIVPAISWATTYHPLQQYGLRLRFVDVDLETFNMDVTKLESALTPKTRMIVAVSILGNPAALDRIRAFADAHGLILLEDNCESLGAELSDGRKTGTFGDLNTFSFFFSHHIATMEGGMVLTDDPELRDLLLSLRAHGWTRELPPGSSLYSAGDDDFFEAYRFILPGYNVRPMEMAGAIGREQLKKLPRFLSERRRNLALFQRLFADDKRFLIQRENGNSSSFCFPIVLNPELRPDRDRIFSSLRKAGIGFRMVTGGCFPRHDAIRHFDYEIVGNLNNANAIHDYGFFIGNHPFDLTKEIESAHQILDEVFN